jgi:hypothetical protein
MIRADALLLALRAKSILVVAAVAIASNGALAAKPKPEKIPVALGSWKGPGAGGFKDAMRRGLSKDCKIVGAKTARVVVDGVVTAEGKGATVQVIVKLPRTGEVVERRDFHFARPKASRAQGDKMGHAVAEIARRAPTD